MSQKDNIFLRLLRRSEIRYVIVGTATFLVDNIVFNIYNFIPDFSLEVFSVAVNRHFVFNILGMVAGLFFGFIVNRKWSFKATGNVTKQFLKCLLLFVFNTFVSSLIVGQIGAVVESGLLISFLRLLVSISIGVWNFFAYKFFVYKS